MVISSFGYAKSRLQELKLPNTSENVNNGVTLIYDMLKERFYARRSFSTDAGVDRRISVRGEQANPRPAQYETGPGGRAHGVASGCSRPRKMVDRFRNRDFGQD